MTARREKKNTFKDALFPTAYRAVTQRDARREAVYTWRGVSSINQSTFNDELIRAGSVRCCRFDWRRRITYNNNNNNNNNYDNIYGAVIMT